MSSSLFACDLDLCGEIMDREDYIRQSVSEKAVQIYSRSKQILTSQITTFCHSIIEFHLSPFVFFTEMVLAKENAH